MNISCRSPLQRLGAGCPPSLAGTVNSGDDARRIGESRRDPNVPSHFPGRSHSALIMANHGPSYGLSRELEKKVSKFSLLAPTLRKTLNSPRYLQVVTFVRCFPSNGNAKKIRSRGFVILSWTNFDSRPLIALAQASIALSDTSKEKSRKVSSIQVSDSLTDPL